MKKVQTTRLTSIPISYPTRLGSSFWKPKVCRRHDSMTPLGSEKKFPRAGEKSLYFCDSYPISTYTYIYILPTFQPHTPPSYYITKLWIKHEKKNHGPPELSTVFPTLWYNAICQQAFTTDFMHTGHPVPLMLYGILDS